MRLVILICLLASTYARPGAIQGGPLQLVTLPHGPGWPSIHLTPPLHNFGHAAFSPYQRLPFFYNTYLFSPLNYRFAHKNSYLTFLEENHAKSSQKDISFNKIDAKGISIGNNKNKNPTVNNNASQTRTFAKFVSQKDNLKKTSQNQVVLQKSVDMNINSNNKNQAISPIPQEQLIALAQYNERQKQLKESNQQAEEKTVSGTNLSTKRKLSKLTQNERHSSKTPKEEKLNPLKDQIESFGTESQLDYKTKESDLRNMKLVENLVERSRTNSKLNESLVLNDVRLLKKIQNLNEKLTDPNEAFFAPYKNNPLFTYLRDKHTLDFSKLIEYKSEEQNLNTEKDTVTLILKPMARAVAGLDGRAMATPLSRAVVERGTNADILFEPDAVAIVGPGGIAHAQSELEVGYVV